MLMRRIISVLDGSFCIKDKKLFLKLPNHMTFAVKSAGIIDVISEIFFFNNYNFNSKSNFIALDIGMNVGVASLFFASFENIRKVYSFEPFKQTYDCALENFELNGNLSNKIVPNNFGISDKDGIFNVDYSFKNANGMSIKISSNSPFNILSTKSATATVKSINYIFSNIIPRNTKEKILLKIDCEGCEYEIFEEMDKNNFFENVNIILLEWHNKGPKPLLNILNKNGYDSFLTGRCSANAGMMYSIKSH